jgi:hypothetical protein
LTAAFFTAFLAAGFTAALTAAFFTAFFAVAILFTEFNG